MNLEYKDRLINIANLFIEDMNIGELEALSMAEKVVKVWIKGDEDYMEENEVMKDLRKVVEEFYLKYPEHKITLALSQMLDVLVVEEQINLESI